MLKKTIKYVDFDENERTEDFYFNLTEAEVAEMEMSTEGGLIKRLEKIVAMKDAKQIIEAFKDLILRSYGEKSLDGKHFVKNDAIREKFASTNAYSQLFMELALNADAAATFVNGVIPQKK